MRVLPLVPIAAGTLDGLGAWLLAATVPSLSDEGTRALAADREGMRE